MVKNIVGLSMTMLMLVAAFAITPVAAQDTIAATRTISDTTVVPGGTFTVTVEVDITGTVYGPVLNEDLPAGWTVTEVDSAGGVYNPDETKWLWGGAQTIDKTVIYGVTVPEDAAETDYPVAGTVLATVGGSTIGPFTVSGDDSITVADWNTWDDDCVISDEEISLAEYYWATSTPIKGHTITDEEISLLEYQWATGDVC